MRTNFGCAQCRLAKPGPFFFRDDEESQQLTSDLVAFYCYHVDSIIYLVSIPILAMFTLVTEYTNYLLYWCFIRYKEALHWWMSTSIKARGVFEGTIIQQIRVYLGSTVVAYWYVYNKVYQQYSTVGGNRVCPAAARLWVKSMGKGQRGFPKRHQLDLLQELFSHLSFLSRLFNPSLHVTSFC